MKTRSPRFIYFIVGIVGGLAAGAGATSTWMTFELGGDTTRKGIDTPAGRIALGLGLATIVLTLITRKGSTEEPRRCAIAVTFASGAGFRWQAAWKRDGETDDTVGLPSEPRP